MATEIVKSTYITNLDARPVVRATSGQGGSEYLPRKSHATAAVTSGVTAAGASYYRMIRLPSVAVVKKVEMWLDAAGTTITGDIGIYYSDSTNPGDVVTESNEGDVINVDHFASAVALAAVVVPTDYTSEAGTYLGADRELPLWNTAASGLTVDPRGFIDIVFTLTSTAGSAAVLNMNVEWALPGA